jgi:hypothetical protein
MTVIAFYGLKGLSAFGNKAFITMNIASLNYWVLQQIRMVMNRSDHFQFPVILA